MPTLILIGARGRLDPGERLRADGGCRARPYCPGCDDVYPGAYHDFDHPSLPLQQRNGVLLSAGGAGRVHVRSDPAARADALRRVAEWLTR